MFSLIFGSPEGSATIAIGSWTSIWYCSQVILHYLYICIAMVRMTFYKAPLFLWISWKIMSFFFFLPFQIQKRQCSLLSKSEDSRARLLGCVTLGQLFISLWHRFLMSNIKTNNRIVYIACRTYLSNGKCYMFVS